MLVPSLGHKKGGRFMARYVYGLCKGRHDIPVLGYLFPEVVENPMDFR